MKLNKYLINGILLFGICSSVYSIEYDMPNSGNDLVGENYSIIVRPKDSLTTIRESHGVSYNELLEANPNINFYKLRVGQEVIIPKQFILPKFRNGIIINVAELRLYYFTPDGRYVYTYPAGLGRENWRTPLADATVVRKQADPSWHVPNSIKNYVLNKTGRVLPDVVPPGPKNPLGNRALYLSKSGYLIHGTDKPHSVGTFISSGCVRLLRDPIEELYNHAQIGTKVHIIHYPHKAGWLNKKLYLESHPEIDSYTKQPVSPLNEISAKAIIYEAIRMRPARIDWSAVRTIISNDTGVPRQIGTTA